MFCQFVRGAYFSFLFSWHLSSLTLLDRIVTIDWLCVVVCAETMQTRASSIYYILCIYWDRQREQDIKQTRKSCIDNRQARAIEIERWTERGHGMRERITGNWKFGRWKREIMAIESNFGYFISLHFLRLSFVVTELLTQFNWGLFDFLSFCAEQRKISIR